MRKIRHDALSPILASFANPSATRTATENGSAHEERKRTRTCQHSESSQETAITICSISRRSGSFAEFVAILDMKLSWYRASSDRVERNPPALMMLPDNIELTPRVVDASIPRMPTFFIMPLHPKPVANLGRRIADHFAVRPAATGSVTR